MNAGVALILTPTIDSATFLPLAREILGYSPSKIADSASLSEIAHQLVTLAAFKNKDMKSSVHAALAQLNLLHAGFLVANDERDTVEIVEIASMSFATTHALSRGIDAIILSGSLVQWREAVKRGCCLDVTRDVRYVFNSIHRALCKIGLKEMFIDLQQSNNQDQTFLLEDKR